MGSQLSCCLVWTLLATAAVSPAQTRPAATQPAGQVIVGEEIFGNQAAADLVQQARLVDPLCGDADAANRDKAAALYAQAIDLQPGASLNAALAARIAELYAWGELRTRSIRPDQAKAQLWWRRTKDLTDPTQLLWARACLGLGSSALATNDYPAAIASFKLVLDLPIQKLRLPDYKFRALPHGPDAAAQSAQALGALRKHAASLQLLAAGEIGYAAAHMSDTAQARTLLRDLAGRYTGTPVGDCLADQLTRLPTHSQAGDIGDPAEP